MGVDEGTWGRGRGMGVGEGPWGWVRKILGVYSRIRGVRSASLDLSSQPDKALLVLSPAQSPRSPHIQEPSVLQAGTLFFMAWVIYSSSTQLSWTLGTSLYLHREELLPPPNPGSDASLL